MRRVFAGLLVAACLALPGRAQEPPPEAMKTAHELIGLVGGDTMDQLSGALITQIWTGLENELRGKVDAATLAELRVELERQLTRFVGEALKDAPAIYARHFTVAEMGDLIAFYKTPTGAKALRELPKVTAESYALVMPRLAAFQQEVSAAVDAIMKKHGYGK